MRGPHLLRLERPGPPTAPESPVGRREGAQDAQWRMGESLPGHWMHLRSLEKANGLVVPTLWKNDGKP